MYEGIIREKPSSKEEAWDFIKGLLTEMSLFFFLFVRIGWIKMVKSLCVAGYSGGQAGVIGSVLVTNLKTGKRKGEWCSAEVLILSLLMLNCLDLRFLKNKN